MKILAGAAIGGLIVGILAFMLWGRSPADPSATPDSIAQQIQAAIDALPRAKPRYATITLRKSETARCLAEIDNRELGAFQNEPVKWTIADHEDNPCRPDGPWAVWLVFEGADLPFNQRDIRIGRSGRAVPIKADALKKNYRYKVWMRGHNNADYELIDPDLEVEDPPRIIK